jgi:hypothetical protein
MGSGKTPLIFKLIAPSQTVCWRELLNQLDTAESDGDIFVAKTHQAQKNKLP